MPTNELSHSLSANINILTQLFCYWINCIKFAEIACTLKAISVFLQMFFDRNFYNFLNR